MLFFLGVYLFDWLQFIDSGFKFHLGVQGRYFFPLIQSHMIFIALGWRELFRFFPALFRFVLKMLVLLMFLLHWYALLLISFTYYHLNSFSIFISQASQYKPWFFKGFYLITAIVLALTINLWFLLKYLKRGLFIYAPEKNR